MIDLGNLKASSATTIIFCCAVFFEVVLAIFVLDRFLFFSLNLWQMVAVGIGVSLPALIVTGFMAMLSDPKGNSERRESVRWSAAGLITFMVASVSLVVSYFLRLSFKMFVFEFLGMTLLLFIIMWIDEVITGRQKKKSVQKPSNTELTSK